MAEAEAKDDSILKNMFAQVGAKLYYAGTSEHVPTCTNPLNWYGDLYLPSWETNLMTNDGGFYTTITKRGNVLGVKLDSLQQVNELVVRESL